MKFRKKPVVIDAWLVADLIHTAKYDWEGLPEEIKEAYNREWVFLSGNSMSIHTREGTMLANLDDVIIMEIPGKFYPCKPDIFNNTYELAE